jgi:hypothetical protein
MSTRRRRDAEKGAMTDTADCGSDGAGPTRFFARRPEAGIHDDAPGDGGMAGRATRVVVRHANGTAVPSDMPTELGGTGDLVHAGMGSSAPASPRARRRRSRWPRRRAESS